MQSEISHSDDEKLGDGSGHLLEYFEHFCENLPD